MPHGKPAGVRCIQLTHNFQCAVFDQEERPSFCAGLQPALEMCGTSREQALLWLNNLEMVTRPSV